MLIIIDKKLPAEAKEKLNNYGEVYELETSNIVYDAISGHPDIFVFQNNEKLIIAPKTPISLINRLTESGIVFEYGNIELGAKYPLTTVYNIATYNNIFIGNNKYCDTSILELSRDKKWIQTKQSYARCNSIIIDNESIITSDHSLEKHFKKALIIKTKDIILQGFEYGFIGGCAGIYRDKIFFTGSLNNHSQGKKIRAFCEEKGFTIIELSEGKLIDSGGIFFVE